MFLGEYKKFSNIFYCIGQLGTFPITFNTSLTQKKKKKENETKQNQNIKIWNLSGCILSNDKYNALNHNSKVKSRHFY